MSAISADVEGVADRLRALQAIIRGGIRSGKADSSATAAIQETTLSLITHVAVSDVTLAGLRCVDDALTAAPSTVTLVRLEGGVAVLPKVWRLHQTDAILLATAARVTRQICATSSVATQLLAKDKVFASSLLTACRLHIKNAGVVIPLCEVLSLITKCNKGACILCSLPVVPICQQLLFQYAGNLGLVGTALHVLKNVAKHDAARMLVLCGAEVTELLMGVARSLSLMTGQSKLLKRVSRTLWLLHCNELRPLPELEAHWPLPPKDSPHLLVPAATDGDALRSQELFPDECAAVPVTLQEEARAMHQVRPPTVLTQTALPAARLTQLAGCSQVVDAFHDGNNESLQCTMMMHDLQRIVYRTRLINNLVYCNTGMPAAASSTTTDLPAGPPSRMPLAAGSSSSNGNSSPSRVAREAPRVTAGAPCQPQSVEQHQASRPGSSLDVPFPPASCEHAEQNECRGNTAGIGGLLPCPMSPGGGTPPAPGSDLAIFTPAWQALGDTPPLAFESRFEGANLRQVVQVTVCEYDLFLSPDLNDRSEGGNLVQWFHFAVSGARPGVAYKFNLVNFRKKSSLFGSGKRPVVCRGRSVAVPATTAEAAAKGDLHAAALHAWHRSGTCIAYYPSPYRGRGNGQSDANKKVKKVVLPPPGSAAKKAPKQGSKAVAKDGGAAERPADYGPGLYCCTFVLTFPSADTFFVASCYPYSYTEVQDHLQRLCSPPLPDQAQQAVQQAVASAAIPVARPHGSPVVRSLLCWTLAGQRCDLLTITDFTAPADVIRQRECIMLTARVHPGETCASWIMQGILDFLVSSEPAALTLRSSFVFKIVPMLNPDGVVNGNYRCSLTGCDLNRVWDKPARATHPTIYHSKKVLQALAGAGRLALFIDIHGHSNKEDAFFYGCEPNLMSVSSSNKDVRKANVRGSNEGLSLSPQDAELPALGTNLGSSTSGSPVQAAVAGASVAAGGAPTSTIGGAAGAFGAGGGGVEPTAGKAGLTARVAARLRVRMLPYLSSKISSDYNFQRAQFRVRKAKLSAARVVVNRELGVAGSYTLEASLGGRSTSRTHFSIQDYLQLGHKLCRAIAELAEVDDAALLDDMLVNVPLPATNNNAAT